MPSAHLQGGGVGRVPRSHLHDGVQDLVAGLQVLVGVGHVLQLRRELGYVAGAVCQARLLPLPGHSQGTW